MEEDSAFYSLMGVSHSFNHCQCSSEEGLGTFYSLLGVSLRQQFYRIKQEYKELNFLLPFGSFLCKSFTSTCLHNRLKLSTPFWEFHIHVGVGKPYIKSYSLLSTPFWEFHGYSKLRPRCNSVQPKPFYSLLGVSGGLVFLRAST